MRWTIQEIWAESEKNHPKHCLSSSWTSLLDPPRPLPHCKTFHRSHPALSRNQRTLSPLGWSLHYLQATLFCPALPLQLSRQLLDSEGLVFGAGSPICEPFLPCLPAGNLQPGNCPHTAFSPKLDGWEYETVGICSSLLWTDLILFPNSYIKILPPRNSDWNHVW